MPTNIVRLSGRQWRELSFIMAERAVNTLNIKTKTQIHHRF